MCTADVRFMLLSNIAIFFEQVCSTKMAIILMFFEELNDKNECKLKPAVRATFCNFFTEIGAVVQKLGYFE